MRGGEPHSGSDRDDETVTRAPAFANTTDGVLPGGEALLGRFELLRELGRGGSGVVYAARDLRVGRTVAVKLLHTETLDDVARERLRREVRAAGAGHPNLVGVYDLVDNPARGLTFLVLELVDGASLRAMLKERPRLPVEDVVRIGQQVANALEHLHGQGIVHRDVKPGNILIDGDGTAKLCDFGLARPVADGPTVTEAEMVVGTPAFMAPEQGTSAAVGPAADIYALGLVLYQALTGIVPLRAESAVETLVRRQEHRAPPVRSLSRDNPRWLDRLLAWMLDPDPRQRPSAAVVSRTLAGRRLAPRVRLRRTWLVAASVLLVAIAASLLLLVGVEHPVRIELLAHEVRGVASSGTPLWSLPLKMPVLDSAWLDLDGDGIDELAVSTTPDAESKYARSGNDQHSMLLITNRSGERLYQGSAEDLITKWGFLYPKLVRPLLYPLDVDHDGRSELVVVCNHRNFYPSVVLVYWPSVGRWQQVLSHSGNIYRVAGRRDGVPGFLVLAVNNRLLRVPAVGMIRCQPTDAAVSLGSPDLSTGTGIGPSWDWYRPLPTTSGLTVGDASSLEVTDDGSVLVSSGRATTWLDPSGNPADSPNRGRETGADTVQYLWTLSQLAYGLRPLTQEGVKRRLADADHTFAAIRNEPPLPLVTAVLGARALATAGDHPSAIQRLRAAPQTEETQLRLAHLLAVSGDLLGALNATHQLLEQPGSPRVQYDVPHLLLRLGIALQRPEETDEAVTRLTTIAFNADIRELVFGSLRARTRLWWDQLEQRDTSIQSTAYTPAGEALAVLARWRLDTTRAEDADAMRAFTEDNLDAASEGRVALVAALLGSQADDEALREIESLIATLGISARVDFHDRQLLELAEALRVQALLDTGRTEDARSEAARLLTQLSPGLLPAILCKEVLDESKDPS